MSEPFYNERRGYGLLTINWRFALSYRRPSDRICVRGGLYFGAQW